MPALRHVLLIDGGPLVDPGAGVHDLRALMDEASSDHTIGPTEPDDQVVPRASVVLSLAADHRETDGQMGSRFLNRMDSLLQRPEVL